MPLENDIETVVGLIEDGHVDQAVAVWSELRGHQKRCQPCFYSPLDEYVRCASCLESNLSTALLKRAYARVTQARLQAARDALDAWIAQGALAQTG